MKGLIFTEFLELVETCFGMEVADQVITKGCPFHTSGFTSVGTYDHRDLLSMVGELSKVADVASRDLVFQFGKRMFGKFLEQHPEAFERVSSTFELLLSVEDVIHVEVRKINPEAELPSFTFPATTEGSLDVVYQSSRPFADLAHGLISASIAHFKESLEIIRTDLEGEPNTHAMFSLRPVIDERLCEKGTDS
jgi:Haem-NO-binding